MRTELTLKREIVSLLAEGFVLAPCANPDCEQLFASDVLCAGCEATQ
jgi:hypothetical protein